MVDVDFSPRPPAGGFLGGSWGPGCSAGAYRRRESNQVGGRAMASLRPRMMYVALIGVISLGYWIGAATVAASDRPDNRAGEWRDLRPIPDPPAGRIDQPDGRGDADLRRVPRARPLTG